MYGITIIEGPSDWEVIQQIDGFAKIKIVGNYQVEPAGIETGILYAIPMVRVMREEDNSTVAPWMKADVLEARDDFSGSFEVLLQVPCGGLYRIDTSLEAKSEMPDVTWLYRGDCILHLAVGNLFMIAGQSNAAGFSRDSCTDEPSIYVHLFRNQSKWDLACHPMNESTGAGSLANVEQTNCGVSPYLSFAKKYYKLTGIPVGLIQTALGGSSIEQWKPDEGSLYQNLMDKIEMTKGQYSGILWYQGCSDALPELSQQYYENFKQFVLSVRNRLGYTIPFFTFQLNRQINGLHNICWGEVREAQRKAAENIEGVYILPTTNCSLSDGIHNSAQANLVLGEKLAHQCVYVLNHGEEFLAPTLEKAEMVTDIEKKNLGLEGEWLQVTFSHVKNCLFIFSGLGSDSGFTLEDKGGKIEIERIRANREDKNQIYLKIGRVVDSGVRLSFAWEADPVRYPLVDETTYLPPVSFYKIKI